MSNPRLNGLPALCSTGDVAAVLDWDQRTVRNNLVPIEEWKARVKEDRDFYTRKAPGCQIGGEWKIPRWWLEGLFRKLSPPDGAE